MQPSKFDSIHFDYKHVLCFAVSEIFIYFHFFSSPIYDICIHIAIVAQPTTANKRYWKNNRWDYVKGNDTARVHPLDGEVYAQIINLSCSYDVYFHGAVEVPNISKQRYSFAAADYTTVELLALEILTSSNARE